ncbi:Cupin domain-containing protein [Amycolatopsis saalfeldensis]|uniref:Cupin domain-containing protein n=1 Tax=Amycolatopsis saalfeldensis TaxID=394193 RepID=A0A1H8YL65_9PSEU|nr:Cupin domain-containing protein [Amycolatopsis saalfeldensis]
MSEWRTLSTVEGRPLLGGTSRVRELQRAPSGLAYEIHYPAGVASPPHSHDHDSIVYLLEGHLKGTVDGVEASLRPGDSVLHPRGVTHQVEAIVDSAWVEFKSPLPERPPVA